MTDREMRKLKRQDLLQMLVALLCTVVDTLPAHNEFIVDSFLYHAAVFPCGIHQQHQILAPAVFRHHVSVAHGTLDGVLKPGRQLLQERPLFHGMSTAWSVRRRRSRKRQSWTGRRGISDHRMESSCVSTAQEEDF